jgi:hypothetical protein
MINAVLDAMRDLQARKGIGWRPGRKIRAPFFNLFLRVEAVKK